MRVRLCRMNCLLVVVAALALCRVASAQGLPLSWEDSGRFQLNIQDVTIDKSVVPWRVKIVFSVSDSTNPNGAFNPLAALWDIKNAPPFTSHTNPTPFPTAAPRMSVDVGWDTTDYTNNTVSVSSDPVLARRAAPGNGVAPAAPVSINALTASVVCDRVQCPTVAPAVLGRTYYVVAAISPVNFSPLPDPVRTGVVTIWGHPVIEVGVDTSGATVWGNVPVKSVYQAFTITDAGVDRRNVVDIAKCKGCHDGKIHGTTEVPRLTLHGANRTEEPGVCVVCHNPSQTDIPYRTSGAEESVDFKRMVHGIHAGGMRRNPLVIIGRNGSVNDYSGVRFPAELSNCILCHIDDGSKGTFELPLAPGVLGSTISTGSRYNTPGVVPPDGYTDISPWNDRKITPIASACSACHDSSEVRRHMVSNGASFSTPQSAIWSGAVRERCASCHGPGKSEDVRKVHEIGDSEDSEDSLRIDSAVFKSEDLLLRVIGDRAPAGATLSVSNSSSGAVLGTVVADREGKWGVAIRLSLSRVPRYVTARAGTLSATAAVTFD